MSNTSGYSGKEGLAYGFKVSITNSDKKKSDVHFSSCDGLQSEVEVQFLTDGSASDRSIPVRGRKLGGIINFSRGVAKSEDGSSEFYKWFKTVCDSGADLKKKTLTISLVDPTKPGEPIAKWEVYGAWPCRWSGPFLETQITSPTVERISFAYESILRI